MPDLSQHCQDIERIRDELDPRRDGVALYHLADALNAIYATMEHGSSKGQDTGDIVVRGTVFGQEKG